MVFGAEYTRGLIDRYYSTHYKHFMPQSAEGWKWVLDRFELNFGDIFASIPRDKQILDVGCGVGYLEYYLLEKGFKKIRALDLSQEQLLIAGEKLTELDPEYSNVITFEIQDALETLQAKNQCDVLVMIDFLEHFSKRKVMELLHLGYRALRDNGLLILRTSNAANPIFGHFFYRDFSHETPFTVYSMRQVLQLAGFAPIRVDYEKMPRMTGGRWIYRVLGPLIDSLRLKIAGKLLGVHPSAFSEDLIAVAEK